MTSHVRAVAPVAATIAILSLGCGTDKPTAPGSTNPQMHLTGAFDGDSNATIGTPYDVTQHFHFIVANASGDSVGSVPVSSVPSVQWMLATPVAPAPAPSCSVAAGVLTLSCPASSGLGYNGFFVVTVQPGTAAGVTNPSYLGTFDLYVGPTSTVQLHFVGIFDGDSTVGADTAYNVAQHFRFVVSDASGDSIGAVPVVNVPAIQWVFRSGAAPTTPPGCPTTAGVLVLSCPASDAPAGTSGGAFTGYYVVTAQPDSLNGVTNPSYRPTFDLNVTPGVPIVKCAYVNGALTCLSAQSGAASARNAR